MTLCAGLVTMLGCLDTRAATSNPARNSAQPSSSATHSSIDSEVSAIASLSLEDLMNVQVTSVSKRSQALSEAPAAIHVITQEDLRRLGISSIPEALRLAPGMHVARQDGSSWAISSRGFTDIFANKLLVMMDGRSVYTPLFSGVYWQLQSTLMEDVDRIEVIRGPGATLWGANAVNGVINIITRSSRETQGTLITGGMGLQEKGFGAVRHGGKLADRTYFKLYGKYFDQDDTYQPNDSRRNDAYDFQQGGFRLDSYPSDNNTFTLQGDGYYGRFDQTVLSTGSTLVPGLVPAPVDRNGQNILGRWQHEQSDTSKLQVQTYWDRTFQEEIRLSEERNSFDLDIQQGFTIGERHLVTMGTGYRMTTDRIRGSFDVQFSRAERTLHLFSLYAQDEITLFPEKLILTLGTKFERNDFTGFETQPSARLLWNASKSHTLWASAARAVRTPSRADDDVRLNFITGVGTARSILGNPNLRSEVLNAFELGHRWQILEKLSLDTALFYNEYTRLRGVGVQSIGPDPALPLIPTVTQLVFENQTDGEVYGGELATTWKVLDIWTLRPSYSLLLMRMHLKPAAGLGAEVAEEGQSPVHQAMLRSSVDLPGNVTWDALLRYVGGLRTLPVPAYFALDSGITWRPRSWVELSVVGQNLLDDHHPEFKPITFISPQSEIPRSVFGKVTFRF